MADVPIVSQCPEPIDTTSLHFKSLTKFSTFNTDGETFSMNTNLVAISQSSGLTFVGTLNGFLILKSKYVFTPGCNIDQFKKEIVLHCRTTHLATTNDDSHLAVACQTKMGPVYICIYNIPSFLTKGVIPIKTIPLSKPFQGSQILDMQWQPNNEKGLIICFTDGSVSSFNLFQGSGNDVYSLPSITEARCLCWSPKGKQIVIGCRDGSLSQYKPDLKFVKKLDSPPLFNGAVTVVNVLWLSNFQFLAAYKDANKTDDFPVIVIVNARKNEPVNFINYDDITYSSAHSRPFQFYFYHLFSWNVILIASANSIEVAVLHASEDNTTWEQWLLGDASRAELPLNSNKSETFPLGMSFDYTSSENIPWGEETLPPMPRLAILSCEGLLITFNVINTEKSAPNLCSGERNFFDDSWFAVTEKTTEMMKNVKTGQSSENTQSQVQAVETTKPTQLVPSTFSSLTSTSLSPSDGSVAPPAAGVGSLDFKMQPPKQIIPPMQQQTQNQILQPQVQVQTGSLQMFQNPNSSSKWSQKPTFSFSMWSNSGMTEKIGQTIINKPNEGLKNIEQSASFFASNSSTPQIMQPTESKVNSPLEKEQKSSETTIEARRTTSGVISVPTNLSSTQVVIESNSNRKKSRKTSPSRSTHSVYVTALWDEVYHFNLELKEVISRVSASKILIGTEEEKESLRNLIEKLKNFENGLSETTASQKNEIQAIKSDVMEAFAWLEDARSRNRQRKSPTFIELKKSQDLDPICSRLMTDIHRLKYYIENQLKQLYSYLMKEWMQHQDNCRHDIKATMAIPSMEELYKTMHLELKILSKQRLIVEELREKIKEKNFKNRDITMLTNSSRIGSEGLDNNRMSELFKLADNLLQIKIGRDEQKNEICVTDAFQIMMEKQISAIAEKTKKFTPEKQNILRDLLTEREMLKTRSIKSTFTSSSFIRNASSRINSKTLLSSKWTETENDSRLSTESPQPPILESMKKENFSSEIVNSSTNKLEFSSKETVSSAIDQQQQHQENSSVTNQKPSELFISSVPKLTTIHPLNENEINTSGTNEQKTTPFMFKAAITTTTTTTGINVSLPKSLSVTAANTQNSYTVSIPIVTISSTGSSSDNFSFKFTDVTTTSTAPITFSFVGNKTSSAFSPRINTNFSASVFGVNQSTTNEGQSQSTVVFPFSSNITNPTATSSSESIVGNSTNLFPFSGPLTKSSSGNSIFASSSSSSSSPSSETVVTAAITPTTRSKSFSQSNVTLPGKSIVIPSSSSAEEITSTMTINLKGTTPVAFTATTTSNNSPTVITTVVVTTGAVPTFTPSTAFTVVPVTEVTTDDTESEVLVIDESREDGEKFEDSKATVAEADTSTVITSTASIPNKTEVETSESVIVQSVTTISTTTTPSTGIFNVAKTSPTLGIQTSNSNNIFGQGNATSATIFSTTTANIFSPTKTVTTGSTIFGSPTAVTSTSSIFGQPTATTSTSGNIFGQASNTPTTFGQPQKDEISQTANLFGEVLGSNLSSRNIFETPTSTTATGNIFGKSSFEKSGVSIFGNASVAATTTAMTTAAAGTGSSSTSIFGSSSSNIFSKSLVPQTQMPTSTTTSIFGQRQNTDSGNNFFGQNICNTFGSRMNTSPNQNPFASVGGFNSKPVFGQSLFGQNSTGQNPFERSQQSSIFGGSSTTQNVFQSGSSSFGGLPPGPFSGGQSTTGQTGIGGSSAFQKPLGGNIFGSSTSFTRSGTTPTFGGAPTFGSPATFGSPQKVFGSPQGTFGQNQANAPTFGALAKQTDGFANLALQSQSQTPAFGGNTFNQSSNFGGDSNFGGTSFSSWRS